MPGWRIPLTVVTIVASLHAAKAARSREVPSTRELLTIMLASPAGDQPTTDTGPCTRAADDATQLRSDVIDFLARLPNRGSIASECREAGTTIECRLVIGRATGRDEAVWTRTYALALEKGDHRVKEPVECYTTP